MKHIASLFLVLFLPLMVFAAPLKDYPLEDTQPNGKTVKLLVTGDEFYRVATDEQGYTLTQDKDGYIVYATRENGALKPTSFRVGETNPVSLGLGKHIADDPGIIKQKVISNPSYHKERDVRNNTTGSINNIVIFLNFHDSPGFSHDMHYYNQMFNNVHPSIPSARGFFNEESSNQLAFSSYFPANYPTGTVRYFSDPTHPRGYYLPYSTWNDIGYTSSSMATSRWNAFIISAVDAINITHIIGPTNCDTNSDGVFDALTFIVQGSPDGFGELLWPGFRALPEGHLINGLEVQNYNVLFEYSSLGLACHEMSHLLGFPNLYQEWLEWNSWISQYQYVRINQAATVDVMGWADDYPQHSLVYMKYKYGHWCSLPPTINTEGNYNLNAISSSPFAAYKIDSTWPNQYFIVEYRKQAGLYESHLNHQGLIVYRINTNVEGQGNTDGPPYEVYVYRSYTEDEEHIGSSSECFYSLPLYKQNFNSYTYPIPFLSNGDDGDLCLTEIGNPGTNISFRLSNLEPKIWKGTVSSSWTDLNNWYNGIPDQNYDALIPITLDSLSCFYPVISNTTNVKNLIIDYGAQLTVSNTLIIHEDLRCNGNITIPGNNSVNIYGSAYWKYGSTATMGASNSRYEIRGDMTVYSGANLNITQGGFMFSDSSTHPLSTLYIYENTSLNAVQSYKTYPNYLNIDGYSSTTLTLNTGLFATSGDAIRVQHPGTIDIKGALTIASGAYLNCYDGTIKMSSTTNKTITLGSSASNNLWNLDVAMQNSSTLYLGAATIIKNNLTINSGIFNPANYTITIEGNWTNSAGESAFVSGSGTVIFTGQKPSTCYDEHFNIVVLNKYESEQLIIPSGHFTRIANYDWTEGVLRVNGGDLMIDDLVDNGIYGYWQVDSGNAEAHQDAAGLLELCGYLTVNGGNLKFVYEGAPNTSNWAATHSASLTMTGGTIDFSSSSISIPPLTSGNSITFNCTAGTVKTPYNLSVTRNYLHIYNMTFEMYGSTDATFTYGSSIGTSIGNLKINKGSSKQVEAKQEKSVEEIEPSATREGPLRSSIVTLNSGGDIGGTLNIASGTLNINGYNISTYGGVQVSGNLQMASGSIFCSQSDFTWNNGSTANITGGTITCERNWAFNAGSSVHLDAITVTLLNDDSDRTITCASSDAWFGNLVISMYTDYEIVYSISDASTVPLKVTGSLTIGNSSSLTYTTLNVGSKSVVSGNVLVYNGCKLKLGSNAMFTIGSGRSLTVYNGGTLETIGRCSTPATFTHLSGYYTFNIESGATISAHYTIFEYMGAYGINVKSGATVNTTNTFNYCTFRNGISSGSYRTLLTINNSQSLTCYGAVFPTNTWSGTSNVSKTVNSGTILFQNSTGGFAGESYDGDTYNRINWGTVSCDLSITSFTANPTSQYVAFPATFSATVYNGSAVDIIVPVRIDVYYNRGSLPAEGEIGDASLSVSSLAAYGSYTFTFPATSSTVVRSWRNWCRVDTYNELAESDETNNGYGPMYNTWTALPVVPTPTMSLDSGGSNIQLNWTYPISMNSFNIYRDTDPNGTFSTLVGNTSGNTFSEAVGDQMYFYEIKAVKNWP